MASVVASVWAALPDNPCAHSGGGGDGGGAVAAVCGVAGAVAARAAAAWGALVACLLADARWQVATVVCAAVGFLSLATLLAPWACTFVRYRPQNLRARYGASWALVTGGSSGIGRSLVFALARQGINVVLAAMPDALLEKTAAEVRAAFPAVAVRVVAVNLGSADAESYMAPLRAATDDILVQLVFNNAGYMVTGFFDRTPLARWLANFHCNATAAVPITHHFVARMRAAGARGAVVFTSSPANIIPSPFSSMYGATKAFITHFATSLAAELYPAGIDVAAVHPSPVATAFYTGAHALPTLQMFKGTATGPDRVADVILRGVGRSVVIDQGYYPILFRLMLRVLEVTSLADLLPRLAETTADYQALHAAQGATGSGAPAASAPAASAPAPAPAAASGRSKSPASGRAKSPASTSSRRRRAGE